MSDALNHFRQHGFHIARQLLPREEIDSLKASLAKTIADQLRICGGIAPEDTLFAMLQTLLAASPERYKKVLGSLWRKQDVFHLAHHASIIEFLKTQFHWRDIFVPGGQVVHIMSDRLRIPGGYFGFAPHQDFPSVQGSLDGVVVWIPLVDVDRDNFPLEVIPRSHVQGMLPSIENTDDPWQVHPDAARDDAYIPVQVKAGDVVFMSMFTVHRSSIRGEGNFRLAVSTRFDNGDEASFADRGYPTAYIRTVHREQFVPGFPTQQQVWDVLHINTSNEDDK